MKNFPLFAPWAKYAQMESFPPLSPRSFLRVLYTHTLTRIRSPASRAFPLSQALAYYQGGDMYLFDEFQTSRPAFSRRPTIRNLYDVFRWGLRCLCLACVMVVLVALLCMSVTLATLKL